MYITEKHTKDMFEKMDEKIRRGSFKIKVAKNTDKGRKHEKIHQKEKVK